jgi:hypothetical protein
LKKNQPYFFAGLFLATLFLYWLLTSSIAFIPSWNKALFIATLVIGAVCLIALLRSVYLRYPQPLKPVQWLIIFLLAILMGAIGFFGMAYASIDHKTTGLFSRYANRYPFSSITFYTYNTGLMGTLTHVYYSRRGEIISHEIRSIQFWNEPDSIRIEQKGEDYLIYSPKRKFLFRRVSRVVEEIP